MAVESPSSDSSHARAVLVPLEEDNAERTDGPRESSGLGIAPLIFGEAQAFLGPHNRVVPLKRKFRIPPNPPESLHFLLILATEPSCFQCR